MVTDYASEIMSRASCRNYIFPIFSDISLLFPLLFGTTTPYFLLGSRWKPCTTGITGKQWFFEKSNQWSDDTYISGKYLFKWIPSKSSNNQSKTIILWSYLVTWMSSHVRQPSTVRNFLLLSQTLTPPYETLKLLHKTNKDPFTTFVVNVEQCGQ